MIPDFDLTINIDPNDCKVFVRRSLGDLVLEFTFWYTWDHERQEAYNFKVNQIYTYGWKVDDIVIRDHILYNFEIVC